MSGPSHLVSFGPNIFYTSNVPGKGRVLMAGVRIAKGQRIICEKPLLKATVGSKDRTFTTAKAEDLIAQKIKTLSAAEQQQFFSLHTHRKSIFPLVDRLGTNALPCYKNGESFEEAAVYVVISSINHDCLPNAVPAWNPEREWETIHALCQIKANEEITIDYLRGHAPFEPRQAKFQRVFGFQCTCALCSLPRPQIDISEARREKIRKINIAMDTADTKFKKFKNQDKFTTNLYSLMDCYTLLQLVVEEYGTVASPYIMKAYNSAMKLTTEDSERYFVFMKRAFDAETICVGFDHPWMIHLQRRLRAVRGHLERLTDMAGATSDSTGPGADVFDRWLWEKAI